MDNLNQIDSVIKLIESQGKEVKILHDQIELQNKEIEKIKLGQINNKGESMAEELKPDIQTEAPDFKGTPAYWRVSEVAEFLRCSRNNINNYMRDGRVSYKKVGRNVLIPREEVVRLLGETINKGE